MVAITYDPKRHERNNAYFYDAETRLLKAIQDLLENRQKILSRQDLACSIEKHGERFHTSMWLLTLEGKGLIKKTGSGYAVTSKGRQKLQRKT